MTNKKLLPLCAALLLAFSFAQCKKNHPPPKTELEKLPPITQTGANTFGCLLNGVAWIPKDNYGQATFKLDADPTFQDGVFGVTAIRYYASGKFQSISIGSDSCQSSGVYSFSQRRNNARFTDYGIPLELSDQDTGATLYWSSEYYKIRFTEPCFFGYV